MDFGSFDFSDFFSATDLLMKLSDQEMTMTEAMSSQTDFANMIKEFFAKTKNKAAVANVRQRFQARQEALQDVTRGVYDMPDLNLKYDPIKDLIQGI